MTNLNLFRIFNEIAKVGNMTKASQNLFISQPAVSQSLAQLESELGAKLVERSNKGVVLTQIGRSFYNYISGPVEKLRESKTFVDNWLSVQNGILRIGTNTSNINDYLSGKLLSFTCIYPKIKLYSIKDETSRIFRLLANNELDIGVFDSNESPLDLEIEKILDASLIVIGNKQYYEKYLKKPMSLEDFKNEDLILANKTFTSRQNLDDFFSKNGIILCPKYEMDGNNAVAMKLITEGKGISVANIAFHMRDIAEQKLFIINTAFNFPQRKIYICTDKKIEHSPALKAFLDIIRS